MLASQANSVGGFALVVTFPAHGPARAPSRATDSASGGAHRAPTTGEVEAVSPWRLLWLQFGFSLACVVTYPYFIADLQARFAELSTVTLATLFSLPHLVYLALSAPLGKALGRRCPRRTLMLAFAAMALACWAQYGLDGGGWPWQAGRLFGRLDAAAKWAGVAAGLGAGVLASGVGPTSPLLASAWVLAALGLSLAPRLTRPLPPLSQRKRT